MEQSSAQSNRWVTPHSSMTPPRASYLPVAPFLSSCCPAKFFDLHVPLPAEKVTALQQRRGQGTIVSLCHPCQGQTSWQSRNHLSSRLWQAKRAVLGSITHRPVDIHCGLEVLSPGDDASHKGHPCISLCNSWSWGEDLNYMEKLVEKLMPCYVKKKKPTFFTRQKISNSFKMKLVLI